MLVGAIAAGVAPTPVRKPIYRVDYFEPSFLPHRGAGGPVLTMRWPAYFQLRGVLQCTTFTLGNTTRSQLRTLQPLLLDLAKYCSLLLPTTLPACLEGVVAFCREQAQGIRLEVPEAF